MGKRSGGSEVMSAQTTVALAHRRDPFAFATAAIALLTLFLLGARIFIGQGVSVGHVAALATLPLWLPGLLRLKSGFWIAVTCALSAISACWLTWLAATDHDFTTTNLIANTMLLVQVVLTAGVILWAHRFAAVWLIGAVYGLGIIVSAVMRPSIFAENPWKFAIGLPVAVVLLSMAMATRRRSVEVAALATLALASAAMDSRSYFGVFVLVLLVVVWQMIPASSGRRSSALGVLTWLVAIGVTVYIIGTSLLLEGYLGEDAQQRSIEQQTRAGSILVGGRPELAATAALFLARPIGFGAGTIATPADVLVAKAGMHQIRYDPDNGYVENFMFGTKFELHSVTGDIWAYFGWPGLLFLAVAIALLVSRVAREVADRQASSLFIFSIAISGWNLLFNPLYSSTPYLGLAIGLALISVARSRERPPEPEIPPLPSRSLARG